MVADKQTLRQRTRVKEYENHICDALNPYRYEKSYAARNFWPGFPKENMKSIFFRLKTKTHHWWCIIIPGTFLLTSFISYRLTRHLVKFILKSIFDEKVERLQAQLSSLTNESFANNIFSFDTQSPRQRLQAIRMNMLSFLCRINVINVCFIDIFKYRPSYSSVTIWWISVILSTEMWLKSNYNLTELHSFTIQSPF